MCRCLDAAHSSLLREPHVAPFFDANLQRNQYLSEFALHRTLLRYPHRVSSPNDADFFFVPFYARLAYADKVASKRVRRLQRNLTDSLARCLDASQHWRASQGRDHFVILSSTRDPRKLFGKAWAMLSDSVLLRIDSADFRYGNVFSGGGKHALRHSRRSSSSSGGGGRVATSVRRLGTVDPAASAAMARQWTASGHGVRGSDPSQTFGGSPLARRSGGDGGGGNGGGGSGNTIVIPYYVPHFAEDAAITKGSKRVDVCFFGSATNRVRKRAIAALSGFPNVALGLSEKRSFDAAANVVQGERRQTLRTRSRLRKCKFCLVPAGLTPSSRRLYEAIVAKCVPLLLADKFEPAFAMLLPPQSYAVRAPQSNPEQLPGVVRGALQRWPQLYAGLEGRVRL